MSRPATFVVVTTQRSGSSWVVDLLDSHPSVACYAELFRVADRTSADYGASRVPRFTVTLDVDADPTARRLLPRRLSYLRRLARKHRDACAVGFKLMYDQVPDHPGLLPALAVSGTRFVHVVRRDLLSAVVSGLLVERTGRWRYHRGDEVPEMRVRIEPRELLRRLEEREREVTAWQRRLARLPVRVHELAYEELLQRRAGVLHDLLSFLGVATDVELTSTLVRAGPTQPLDALENAEEVRAVLAGTRFAPLLVAGERGCQAPSAPGTG